MNSSTREAEDQPPEHKKRPRQSVGPSRRCQNCADALCAMNGRRHDAEAPFLRRRSIDLAELRMPDEQQHQGGGRPAAARAQKKRPPRRSTPPDAEIQGKFKFDYKKGIPKYKAEYRGILSRGYSAGRGYSLGIPWVFLAKKNRTQLAKTKKPSHPGLCLCCVERRTKDENTAASTTGLGSAVHHTNGCGRAGRKTDKHTADSRARQQTCTARGWSGTR